MSLLPSTPALQLGTVVYQLPDKGLGGEGGEGEGGRGEVAQQDSLPQGHPLPWHHMLLSDGEAQGQAGSPVEQELQGSHVHRGSEQGQLGGRSGGIGGRQRRGEGSTGRGRFAVPLPPPPPPVAAATPDSDPPSQPYPVLAELLLEGQQVVVAKGGGGGRGNGSMPSDSRRQGQGQGACEEATPGELGGRAELLLEMKLLADVGFVVGAG